MKKYGLLVIIFCIIFNMPVCSKTANKTKSKTLNVVKCQSYTVPTARTEAFKNVKRTIPLINFRSDLYDQFYEVNLSYLKKSINSPYDNSRIIYPTYLGDTLISYGVRYADKPERVYYYNSLGKLLRIEFDNNNSKTYPQKTITYNNKGNLHAVVLYISEKEQYNFDGKGNLVVHWIGERGYNRMGQPLKIRRNF